MRTVGVRGRGLSPDLEDDVSRLEEVVVQTDAGGGQALQGRPGQQGDVGGEEVGEEVIVGPLPHPHLHTQPHLALTAALHAHQVAAEQKWIEDLLSGFICPEPAECSHYSYLTVTSLTTLRNTTSSNLHICTPVC